MDISSGVGLSESHLLSCSQSGSVNDGNLTGKVGTALYVSPEMMTGAAKVQYDQVLSDYFCHTYHSAQHHFILVRVIGSVDKKC